jgi:hypothetical protein
LLLLLLLLLLLSLLLQCRLLLLQGHLLLLLLLLLLLRSLLYTLLESASQFVTFASRRSRCGFCGRKRCRKRCHAICFSAQPQLQLLQSMSQWGSVSQLGALNCCFLR